jgi:hypothetical protein
MATVCLPHRVKFETRASENKTVAYTRRAGRPMCSGSYRTNWTTLSACARASGGHGNDQALSRASDLAAASERRRQKFYVWPEALQYDDGDPGSGYGSTRPDASCPGTSSRGARAASARDSFPPRSRGRRALWHQRKDDFVEVAERPGLCRPGISRASLLGEDAEVLGRERSNRMGTTPRRAGGARKASV